MKIMMILTVILFTVASCQTDEVDILNDESHGTVEQLLNVVGPDYTIPEIVAPTHWNDAFPGDITNPGNRNAKDVSQKEPTLDENGRVMVPYPCGNSGLDATLSLQTSLSGDAYGTLSTHAIITILHDYTLSKAWYDAFGPTTTEIEMGNTFEPYFGTMYGFWELPVITVYKRWNYTYNYEETKIVDDIWNVTVQNWTATANAFPYVEDFWGIATGGTSGNHDDYGDWMSWSIIVNNNDDVPCQAIDWEIVYTPGPNDCGLCH